MKDSNVSSTLSKERFFKYWGERTPRYKTIIVTETGWLLKVGVEEIKEQKNEIVIPLFCVSEMRNLKKRGGESTDQIIEVLDLYYEDEIMLAIKIANEMKELIVQPTRPMKPRTYGIVSVCTKMWKKGYNVILKTTSREAEELANMQGIGIQVERIH